MPENFSVKRSTFDYVTLTKSMHREIDFHIHNFHLIFVCVLFGTSSFKGAHYFMITMYREINIFE